ncbi:MAG: hypothetical protein V4450_15570 [Bacteroidota bacterium]
MRIPGFLFLFILPVLGMGQNNPVAKTTVSQTEPDGKRPNFTEMVLADIKWAKSEGNAFWFYYKPTQYFFKNNEYTTIALENGDIVAYIFELDKYLLLPDFLKAEKNKEQATELASERSAIFIRSGRGRFWIYDKGLAVSSLERIGTNTIHQVVYRSRLSDKRYWIDEGDFQYGLVSKVIGILSE